LLFALHQLVVAPEVRLDAPAIDFLQERRSRQPCGNLPFQCGMAKDGGARFRIGGLLHQRRDSRLQRFREPGNAGPDAHDALERLDSPDQLIQCRSRLPVIAELLVQRIEPGGIEEPCDGKR